MSHTCNFQFEADWSGVREREPMTPIDDFRGVREGTARSPGAVRDPFPVDIEIVRSNERGVSKDGEPSLDTAIFRTSRDRTAQSESIFSMNHSGLKRAVVLAQDGDIVTINDAEGSSTIRLWGYLEKSKATNSAA